MYQSIAIKILILHEQLETQLQSKSWILEVFSSFGEIFFYILDIDRPSLK